MKTHQIESSKNAIFREFLTLLTGRGITEMGHALIFGKKPVAQVLSQNANLVEGLIKTPQLSFGESIKFKTYEMSESIFKELDVFGTRAPILLIKVPEIKSIAELQIHGCGLVIPFQDPSNVGALLRTAAGFGINQIILGPGAAHPFHPKSSRAASGTLLTHQYFKIKDFKELKKCSLPIISLDAKGTNISDFKFPNNFILMPGIEGPGLSDTQKNISDHLISIPLNENVESLNAMVATSISLYAWRMKNF